MNLSRIFILFAGALFLTLHAASAQQVTQSQALKICPGLKTADALLRDVNERIAMGDLTYPKTAYRAAHLYYECSAHTYGMMHYYAAYNYADALTKSGDNVQQGMVRLPIAIAAFKDIALHGSDPSIRKKAAAEAQRWQTIYRRLYRKEYGRDPEPLSI